MRMLIAIATMLASNLFPLGAQGQSQCPSLAQALPLCTVIANAEQYDGKEVLARGLYYEGAGSLFRDNDCPHVKVNVLGSPAYKADKHALSVARSLYKKNRLSPIDEVFRGVFRVAKLYQCFGSSCSSYEIELTELLCAQEAPPDPISAPVITSADHGTFKVGVRGQFVVFMRGNPKADLSERGALPSGVFFWPYDGSLSGTPAAGTAGTYELTFYARNSEGETRQQFTLTVTDAN